MSELRKGQVYVHKRLRGVWTIRSAGPKWVTLDCNVPGLRPERIPTDGFLRAGWERIRDPWVDPFSFSDASPRKDQT